MGIHKWEDLPDFMQCEEIEPYFKSLSKKKTQLLLKRLFDISCALLLIILLSPCILIIAILIKSDSDGPVIFKQERVTQYGKNFKIYKFRTMISNADKFGSLVTVEGDNRITKIGKRIRKCRLDEIPQLINVVKGEMSFVGTRPEVQKYVEQYTNEMKATLLLPAGITSLASIKFKNEDEIMKEYIFEINDIDEIYLKKILPVKMKYNLESIDTFCWFKDIVIMIETVMKV